MCDQDFCGTETLISHMRVQAGEKPINCLECGKSFTQKSTLTRYMIIHSVKRTFQMYRM